MTVGILLLGALAFGMLLALVVLVRLVYFYRTLTRAQVIEHEHRTGKGQVVGPGGFYDVPSDRRFHETGEEHPPTDDCDSG